MTHSPPGDDLEHLVGTELPSYGGFRYKLLRRLGGGGQGNVFLAERIGPRGMTWVVAKIWRPSFVVSLPDISRLVLRKEYVALSRLNERIPPTPFVVRLLDSGDVEVRMRFDSVVVPWLALEYVDGGEPGTSLEERVEHCVATTGLAMSPARARRLLGGIADGVAALHDLGVIHRDLKPGNVLVCGSGDDELPKVADMGLARAIGMMTTFGRMAMGTPGYSAPEQVLAEDVGMFSDVFSFAAIVYFVLTGEEMFGAGTPLERTSRALAGTFDPLSSCGRLDQQWLSSGGAAAVDDILRRATHPTAALRTQTIRELWEALDSHLAAAKLPAPSSASSAPASVRRSGAFVPWSFHVAHREPQSLRLRAIAFDPDGHGLAAGETGLWYWEGSQWLRFDPPDGVDPTAIRFLRRLGPWRWMACGDSGIVVFTPTGAVARHALPEPLRALTAASPVDERTFAVAGPTSGGRTAVIAMFNGVWQQLVHASFAGEISSLSACGPATWLVAGREDRRTGGSAAALGRHAALEGSIEWLPVVGPHLTCGVADSCGESFAAGEGAALRLVRGSRLPSLEPLPSRRAPLAIAADPEDAVWLASTARILRRSSGGPADWQTLWAGDDADGRLITLAAFSRFVIAGSEEGNVIVGRETRVSVGNPSSCPRS